MKRSEREIENIFEIEEIIKKGQICRLAMSEDDFPYIIPMNYGYQNRCFYFHTAKEGKKIDILKKNPKVCFEIDLDTVLVKGEVACKWTMKYKSIIGSGVAELLEDPKEVKHAFDIIMQQYGKSKTFEFIPKVLDMVTIIKVPIGEITGKKAGY